MVNEGVCGCMGECVCAYKRSKKKKRVRLRKGTVETVG